MSVEVYDGKYKDKKIYHNQAGKGHHHITNSIESGLIVTLSRSGRPTNITPRERCVTICNVTGEPRGTFLSSNTQWLTLMFVSTLPRKHRMTMVYRAGLQREILCPPINIITAHLNPNDQQECFWNTVGCVCETKIELFGLKEKHFLWRKKNTA